MCWAASRVPTFFKKSRNAGGAEGVRGIFPNHPDLFEPSLEQIRTVNPCHRAGA
jgi:hypothetical protein